MPSVLLSQMVNVSEILVETSLIASAVVDTKASYVEGYSVEELTQMIDIPLEGGLLEVQVSYNGLPLIRPRTIGTCQIVLIKGRQGCIVL